MTESIPAVFEVLDDRFGGCQGDTRVEILAGGCRWGEGPVYVPAGRYLLFSDIPNDRMLRFDETTGVVGVFRHPCGHANGNTLDREGRLVTCEHSGRRVSRTEHDGSITTIVDRHEGRRFNSPNDVVVRSDGSIWFTDPSYGIVSDYEGVRSESEIGGCHVYRVDPSNGSCAIVADDFLMPNGLAFSPDERTLYIADTDRNHLRAFGVGGDGSLAGGEAIATCSVGVFDGIRVDEDGRIWAAAGDGVHCFAHDGTPIGKLVLPEVVSNLTFGGLRRNRLFMTGATTLFATGLHVAATPAS